MPPAQTSSGSEEKGGASDGAGGTTPPNVSHDALRSVCLMKAGLHSCGPIDTGRPCFISNAPPPLQTAAEEARGSWVRVPLALPSTAAASPSSEVRAQAAGGCCPRSSRCNRRRHSPGGPGATSPAPLSVGGSQNHIIIFMAVRKLSP